MSGFFGVYSPVYINITEVKGQAPDNFNRGNVRGPMRHLDAIMLPN